MSWTFTKNNFSFDAFNVGGPRDSEMVAAELETLRIKAWERLATLGYFAPEAKELQCFNVEIRGGRHYFESPGLPDKFTFQVTTVQKPSYAFIITRNYHIKGKRFNASKCLEPFTACGKEGLIFGSRGKGLYLEQYESILRALTAWNKPPVKRPTK